MLADAALAQVGLADIPSGGGVIPPVFPIALKGIDANAQLLGVDTIPGPKGGAGAANLLGADFGVTLKGSKTNPTVQ